MKSIAGFLAFGLLLLPGSVAGREETLTSGGGSRANGDIAVFDALGIPAIGASASDSVFVSSGTAWGLTWPTPVQLTFLDIKRTGDGVALCWQGRDEDGVAYFRLERALGRTPAPEEAYRVLGPRFPGSGRHRYEDRDVVSGMSVSYRLRARLRTGGEDVLGPWLVTGADETTPVRVGVSRTRPNPFHGTFRFSVTMTKPGPVWWRLLDIRGAQVMQGGSKPGPTGKRVTVVNPPEDLPWGVYFLEVRTPDLRRVQKVVKLP